MGFGVRVATYLLMLILIASIFAVFHESVHTVICERFGGEATVTYGLAGSQTNCKGIDFTENLDLMREYNIQTEIVGYHAYAVVILLLFLFVANFEMRLIYGGD